MDVQPEPLPGVWGCALGESVSVWASPLQVPWQPTGGWGCSVVPHPEEHPWRDLSLFVSPTAVPVSDHAAVAQFCRDQDIRLVVVGPEVPLAAGKRHKLEVRASGI